MTRYQRGSLRIEERSAGQMWVLRFYKMRDRDGKRVEQTVAVGLVTALGKNEAGAWAEVRRLRLDEAINSKSKPVGSPTLGHIAASYQTNELDSLAHTTAATVQQNLRKYILPRWADSVAVDIEPLAVERWLRQLRADGLAAPTTAKLRQHLHTLYVHGQRVGLLPRTEDGNPIKFVRASAKTNYRALAITPEQACAVIKELEDPVRTVAILSAATALRISESLGLQWRDIDFRAGCIYVRRTWTHGRSVGQRRRLRDDPYHFILFWLMH